MSNRAIWNVRQRHQWLQHPLKGKRIKRRARARVGLEAALERRQPKQPEEPPAEEATSPS